MKPRILRSGSIPLAPLGALLVVWPVIWPVIPPVIRTRQSLPCNAPLQMGKKILQHQRHAAAIHQHVMNGPDHDRSTAPQPHQRHPPGQRRLQRHPTVAVFAQETRQCPALRLCLKMLPVARLDPDHAGSLASRVDLLHRRVPPLPQDGAAQHGVVCANLLPGPAQRLRLRGFAVQMHDDLFQIDPRPADGCAFIKQPLLHRRQGKSRRHGLFGLLLSTRLLSSSTKPRLLPSRAMQRARRNRAFSGRPPLFGAVSAQVSVAWIAARRITVAHRRLRFSGFNITGHKAP